MIQSTSDQSVHLSQTIKHMEQGAGLSRAFFIEIKAEIARGRVGTDRIGSVRGDWQRGEPAPMPAAATRAMQRGTMWWVSHGRRVEWRACEVRWQPRVRAQFNQFRG